MFHLHPRGGETSMCGIAHMANENRDKLSPSIAFNLSLTQYLSRGYQLCFPRDHTLYKVSYITYHSLCTSYSRREAYFTQSTGQLVCLLLPLMSYFWRLSCHQPPQKKTGDVPVASCIFQVGFFRHKTASASS